MPKVIIKEYDNTTAGSTEYSNFAVVFPGYVHDELIESGAWSEVADENGVFECTSKKEFLNYVGKVVDRKAEPAEGPTKTTYAAGQLKKTDDNRIVTVADETIEVDEDELYVATTPSTGLGKLDDGTNHYESADNIQWDDDSKNVTVLYLIKKEQIGHDAQTYQKSNRLALMLVELGYTVLYKRVENEEEVKTAEFWECLKDKALYDFRYVTSGGRCDGDVYAKMAGVAGHYSVITEDETEDTCEGRGDATALIDVIEDDTLKGKNQAEAITAIRNQINGADSWFKCGCEGSTYTEKEVGKYVAVFAPFVTIMVNGDETYDGEGSRKTTVQINIPGSIFYLACAAKAAETYNEWYAVAGYTRGVSDYTVCGTTLSLGELAMNTLETRKLKTNGIKRSVNVITKLRTVGNNFYLWGARTAHPLNEDGLLASHFLNIRQLCTTIKKVVYVACKKLTFSPNDMILWADFQEKVRPTLETMKSDRGIADYKFIKVKSKQKATLVAKIKIVPVEPVEDFNIGVYLEDSVNGLSVATDEE